MKLKLVIGWIISAALIAYLVFTLDIAEFRRALSHIYLWQLLVLVLIYLSGFIVRALRSKLMLPALSWKHAVGGILVGYAANNLLPARMGEVARAHIVGTGSGIPRATVFASVLIERVFDGCALVVLLLVGSAQITLPEWAHTARTLGVVIFSTAFLGIIGLRVLEPFITPFVPGRTLKKIVVGLTTGAQLATRSCLTVIGTISFSLLTWFIEGLMFWYGASIFHFDISLSGALVVLGIINLGVLIPSSPGNVGVFQYFCVLALGIYGVSESAGVAYAVVLHACQYLPVTLLGLACLPLFGIKSLSAVKEPAKNNSHV